jgi:signal transduction histidine kinase
MSARRDGDAASEDRDRAFARAVATSELALGLAHALNNAFTVIAGEASFVQSERKDDPLLDEACALIQEQVARCARMTRTLQLRRDSPVRDSGASSASCDVVRVLRDLAPVLEDALSRRATLVIETPEDELLVAATAGDLQTAWLLLAYEAAARFRGSARITLRACADGAGIVLSTQATEMGDNPSRPGAPAAACTDALETLAQRLGASSSSVLHATHSERSLRFERAPA